MRQNLQPLIRTTVAKCFTFSLGRYGETNSNHLLFSFSTEQEVVRNTLLTKIPHLSAEWIVSLKVRFHGHLASPCNIFRMAQGYRNNDYHGDRYPLISVYHYPAYRFQIASSIGSNKNHAQDLYFGFQINQKYSIEIQQRYVSGGNYRYAIYIDGKEGYSVLNDQPRQFYDMNVFLSDNIQAPCPAYVSDLKITNFL